MEKQINELELNVITLKEEVLILQHDIESEKREIRLCDRLTSLTIVDDIGLGAFEEVRVELESVRQLLDTRLEYSKQRIEEVRANIRKYEKALNTLKDLFPTQEPMQDKFYGNVELETSAEPQTDNTIDTDTL